MHQLKPSQAQATNWSTAPRMNELEALMWRSERHPQQSSTMTAVMLLDCMPEWNRLVEAHRWASQAVVRIRQRVLDPALPVGLPAWVVDEHFDLDNHLHRTSIPFGGDPAALMPFAQQFAMQPLDRNRPLWSAVLVEDAVADCAAYILKMHHSMTDGIGGVQLISSVQSHTREHTPDKPIANSPVGTDPSNGWILTVDELTEQLSDTPLAARDLTAAGIGAVRDPISAAARAWRYVGSLRRVLTPPAGGSALLAGRSGQRWRFAVLECPLPQLRASAKRAGGSVNAAYIAALLGGLRRYHEGHGHPLGELPMAMPISLRRPDDPLGGNKFAAAMFAAPLALTDPAERICAVRDTVVALRNEVALDTFSVMAPLLNRLPSALSVAAGRLGARADLSASNVPGQDHESFLAGARVQRIFPFGPLPGVAIMATMVSHVETCCIGLNIDGAAVTDHPFLVDCFAEGLDEVLALGDGTAQ